jgi:hypothetical protein
MHSPCQPSPRGSRDGNAHSVPEILSIGRKNGQGTSSSTARHCIRTENLNAEDGRGKPQRSAAEKINAEDAEKQRDFDLAIFNRVIPEFVSAVSL